MDRWTVCARPLPEPVAIAGNCRSGQYGGQLLGTEYRWDYQD